jgi:hypothetical protein
MSVAIPQFMKILEQHPHWFQLRAATALTAFYFDPEGILKFTLNFLYHFQEPQQDNEVHFPFFLTAVKSELYLCKSIRKISFPQPCYNWM